MASEYQTHIQINPPNRVIRRNLRHLYSRHKYLKKAIGRMLGVKLSLTVQ